MIFADKIITLRKKNGWSQEDLAGRMNVSRQAVAKWESTQAVPSLDKILLLSQLFGVSTDYLLKDDMEEVIYAPEDVLHPQRSVSLEDAHRYLNLRKAAAGRLATGTVLCILAVTPLIFLAAGATYGELPLSEDAASVSGLIILLLMVTAAVMLFIWNGQESKPWAFLESGDFTLDYGVAGMVQEQRKMYEPLKVRRIILGVALCILSPIPIFCTTFLGDTFGGAMMVDLTFFIVAAGVFFLILAMTRSAAMDLLLQEGSYSEEERERSRILEPVAGTYWLIVTAIFLIWGFSSGSWNRNWIIWPVAGVLFAALSGIISIIQRSRQQD